MEKIFVFGHKKPDTDSVCSAIAFSELKNLQGENCEPRVLGELNKETEFILNHFSQKVPDLLDEIVEEKQKVMLVDHNERKQSAKGIENAHILQIVDHHRFSDLHTDEPLYIRSEPVGCTSTIIYKMYKESGIVPTSNIAGLMLSAIISDTLLFNSPTCTSEDKANALELAKIAEIDVEKYGKKMLEKGASIKGLTPKDIIEVDNKHFEMSGEHTVSIAQINTVDLSELMNIKPELLNAMNEYCKNNNAQSIILMITDIIKNGSQLIVIDTCDNKINKTFGIKENSDTVFLSGVVSRKKQIVPKL